MTVLMVFIGWEASGVVSMIMCIIL